MNKLLIKLLLLLAITVLIGKIVIGKEHQEPQEEKEIEEVSDLLVLSNTYVFASSSPVYIRPQVLSTKKSNYIEPVSRYQWDYLLRQYDWNIDEAREVVMCESSGNPNAVGDKNTKYHSYGLFQIRALPGRPSPEWLLVPENNIAYAYELYIKEGRRFGTTGGWYNCSKKLRIH